MAPTHRRVAALIIDNSLLLPVGAAVALVWVNRAPASYDAFAHALHFAVNDIGMALFFALATKEIVEATAPGGALHPLRKALTPVVAACGGMAAPALIYLALVRLTGVSALMPGWAIPSATDIAFSFLVARLLFGRDHPAVPFLLLLAIADDALGLLVLAVFYPAGVVRPIEFVAILAVALAICWMLKRRRIMTVWLYVAIGGVLSWIAFARGGLHPALALVPVLPFVPHRARDAGLFEEDAEPHRDPLSIFEHRLRIPVQGVLLLFGLVNAGVPFSSVGPGTWIVLTGLLVGKPLGIASVTLAGRMAGAGLPDGVTWRDLVVLGCIAGIGFTVALFFCTAAFSAGDLLDQTKMGALLSVAAVPIAALIALVLRTGRFMSA